MNVIIYYLLYYSFKEKQYGRAIEYFREAIELYQFNFPPLCDLILTLLGQKNDDNYAEAQDIIERSLAHSHSWTTFQRAILIQFEGYLHYMIGGKEHEHSAVLKWIEAGKLEKRAWDFGVNLAHLST